MKFDVIKNVITKTGTSLEKNSPTLLTVFGVLGLVSTVGLAIKATPIAIERLEYEKIKAEENGEEITKMKKFTCVGRCYIPTIVMGGVTIGCILGANSINTKRNMALAGAYKLSEETFKDYKSKAIETLGSDKVKEVDKAITKDRIDKADKTVIYNSNGDGILCFDKQSGRLFRSTRNALDSAVNKINQMLLSEMYISLNELYYEIGLPENDLGDSYGWNLDDGIVELDIDPVVTEDGEPALGIGFLVGPKPRKY